MNLIQHHALVFRRRLYFALFLYGFLGISLLIWSIFTFQHLTKQINLLQIKTQPLQKEDVQTMEDIKNNLSYLFSVPLPGISFSVLSLDEVGMRVRGNARSSEALEQWLKNISTLFMIDEKEEKQISQKGLAFEVLLHEKH